MSGCALDERPGDGVVTDGLEVTVSPTLVYDAGGQQLDADLANFKCKSLALFQEKVVPHFTKSCALDCHDGTKNKALLDLNMQYLKSDPDLACTLALIGGLPETLTKKLDAPMLTAADPLREDHTHEFKYMTSPEFNAYRDDVMLWINAERPELP